MALDRWPLDFRDKAILVPIAQAVVAIPFVIRAVVPALRSIDPRLRDAASVLGAPPGRVWREVDLPITMRAFVVAFGFAVAVSLGEFGATLFVARPDTPTIPIAISAVPRAAGRAEPRRSDGDVDGPDVRDRGSWCSRSNTCASPTG